MSKFSRGDIVLTNTELTDGPVRRGQVILTWSGKISKRTGMPLVEVMMDPDNEIAYFDEDEIDLADYAYEYKAVYVDQEDFDQSAIGTDEWGTLEYAERLIQRAKNQEEDAEWKAGHLLQINRRRKAGPTMGHKAYRW